MREGISIENMKMKMSKKTLKSKIMAMAKQSVAAAKYRRQQKGVASMKTWHRHRRRLWQ
jgi:hypothetical protein